MASAKRQRPETETMRVEDVDVLNCGVCCHPLKSPIFQCKEGHVLCSSCCDKLAPTGKCHVCSSSTRGGYQRNRAMERLVENVRVTCPNAAHGCNARLIYYDLADHCQACPHEPCHCPGEACSFVGTTKQLLDHITSTHGWPCTTRNIMARETLIHLQDGFNFFVVDSLVDYDSNTITSTTGHFLFLLNVARQPLDCTISVFCIHPHHNIYNSQGPSYSKAIKCELTYSLRSLLGRFLRGHYLQSGLLIECTNLSDGLPIHELPSKFVIPNSALEAEDYNQAIRVRARFII